MQESPKDSRSQLSTEFESPQSVGELKRWPASSKISDEHKVIRAGRLKKGHVFSLTDKPPLTIFDIQRPDIEEGKKRGLHPLISVWNSDISHEKICLYRKIDPESSTTIYQLDVAHIHKIVVPLNCTPVEVHHDPILDGAIPPEDGQRHFGIQGLWVPAGQPSKHVKNVKSVLREISEPIRAIPQDLFCEGLN